MDGRGEEAFRYGGSGRGLQIWRVGERPSDMEGRGEAFRYAG